MCTAETSVSVQTAEVVIVGAGPAGSTTAAALASRGVDVLLLDKASFPREKTCGDGLSPRSVEVLRQLGLLSQVEAAGAMRIQGIRIYAPSGDYFETSFQDLPGNLPAFGMTIPRRTLDALLLDHARANGARFIGDFRVESLLRDDRNAQGSVIGVRGRHCGEPVTVKAMLTCLATGAAMPLVQEAGLLNAVPPIIRAARSYFVKAAEVSPFFSFFFDREFLPGYGWIFPLAGDRANVGAGYSPTGRFRRRVISPQRLHEHLINQNARVQQELAGASQAGSAKSYPLRNDFSTMRTQGDGVLVVGEAAGLVNPINGEGVDYALESGLMAAETAAQALLHGDLSCARLEVYGRRLRERYLASFYFLSKMRDWYIREWVVNLIVRKSSYRPELRLLFINAALGLIDPREGVSLRMLRNIFF